MLKIKDLIRMTPGKIADLPDVQKNSGSVVVYPIRTIIDETPQGEIYRKAIFKARDMRVGKSTKLLTFRLFGANDNILDDKVWLHCSCEYFTYYLEVPLTTQGSSSVINSNGSMNIEKNARMIPHLCKHAFRVAVDALPKMDFKIPGTTQNIRHKP